MTLQDCLVGTSIRWHQRGVVRQWPEIDNADAPFALEVTNNVADGDSESGIAARIRVGTVVDDESTIALRAAVHISDDKMTAVQDIEVLFRFARETVATDAELAELLRGWGMDLALGYLRGGIAELSTSVALPPLVVDPLFRLDDEHIDGIIAHARRDAEPVGRR